MKTSTRIALLAVGLAAVALPFLGAADTTAEIAVKHPRLHAWLAHRAAIRHHLAQKLGLSADQVAQLKATRAQTVAALKAIRADTSLTHEQKKTQFRAAIQTARQSMLAVLTPDQQAQLRALRTRWFARG